MANSYLPQKRLIAFLRNPVAATATAARRRHSSVPAPDHSTSRPSEPPHSDQPPLPTPMLPESSQPQQYKANLKAWLNNFAFNQRTKRDGDGSRVEQEPKIFGVPLQESLRRASVQISTANASGELYVWGHIPVVVAKCGLYLKENATEVPGTFRVNGSNKRMRDLQAIFEAPPRYGKALDWKQEMYTTHDVASVFRRFLTQMPEPVIPFEMYSKFREALAKQPYNQDEVIATYKRLIRNLPRANQYLLLYVLDLLSVFARKADKNLMTAQNLAVIFRPGILSHPNHEMSPPEHALSQQVVEFLIAHQDWFMLEIQPPSSQASSVSGSSDIDDIVVVPSPSSPKISPLGGPWRMLRSNSGDKVGRRRTMVEHPDTFRRPAHGGALAEGDMSPVYEDDVLSAQGTSATVTRSRTLPARKTGGGGGGIGERLGGRVLRKQKRSSSSQPGRRGDAQQPATEE